MIGRGAAVVWVVALAACDGPTPVEPAGVIRADVAAVPCQDGWAVNYPKQHKLFEIDGRLWLFYSDGVGIVSTTSLDGLAWSPPEVVRSPGSLGHRIGLWFDGAHLHYAFATAETDGDVYYRRGTPEPDGTIAWDGAEQVAYAMDPGANAMYPKVTVDALGRPWIGFVLVEGGITTPPYAAIVTHTDAVDGTWTTAAGFPTTLVADHHDTYPDPAGVALAGGATLWIYNRDDGDAPYYGRIFDGAWRDEEPVTETSAKYGLYAVAADPATGTVDLAYRGGGAVRYRERSADGTWSAETSLTSSGSGHTSITLLGGGDIAVTWLDKGDDEVVFRERLAGAWGDPQLWADESAQALADKRNGINSNALVTTGTVWKEAVVYTTGTEPPYVLRFAGLRR